MDSIEITKAKFIAIRRAQWRLKQRLETIEFEDKLKDEVERLLEMGEGELPQITVEAE